MNLIFRRECYPVKVLRSWCLPPPSPPSFGEILATIPYRATGGSSTQCESVTAAFNSATETSAVTVRSLAIARVEAASDPHVP